MLASFTSTHVESDHLNLGNPDSVKPSHALAGASPGWRAIEVCTRPPMPAQNLSINSNVNMGSICGRANTGLSGDFRRQLGL